MLGRKFDEKKPRWDLLPFEEVEEIVKVLTHGSIKYEDNNWKYVDKAEKRYFAAMLRHLSTYKKYLENKKLIQFKNDSESGLSHLAHAGCCLLFLMWKEKNE